jgi:hypothetical protein
LSINCFDIANEWCRSPPSAPFLCLMDFMRSSTSADRIGFPNQPSRSLSKCHRPRDVSPSLVPL